MANHGFITSKKNFNKEQVRKDLQEINERRFGGLLTIEDSDWGKNGSWSISYKDDRLDYPLGFNIWLCSPKKLEHRHSRGYAYYLEIVFSEEIGAKYNAIISDEGHSDKWKPNPQKYSKFMDWMDILYGHAKISMPDAYNSIVSMEKKSIPKGFEDF